MNRYITWSAIYGIMIGAVTGTVLHSTALGIAFGAVLATVIALVWSALDRNRREPRGQ
jgi:uncharacterized membrane protein YoaK (UPF0700 family)